MFRTKLPLLRRAINTTPATKATISVGPSISTIGSNKTYLDSLSNKLLFSYASIGLCTINKPILNLVIKLFPLIPTKLLDFFIGKIYVGGNTPNQVLQTGNNLSKRGINNFLLSLTIEDAEGTKNIDIKYIIDETLSSIHTILKPHLLKLLKDAKTEDEINSIPPGYIVLKPSAVVSNPNQVLLNYNKPEFAKQWNELNENCSIITEEIVKVNKELQKLYPTRKSPFLLTCVDAEKYDLQKDGVYELQRNLFQKFNKLNEPIQVVGTVQMYLKDSLEQIKYEDSLAKALNYRLGLKLVRGAYIHSEKDRNVIHSTKQDTDNCYNEGVSFALNDISKNKENSTIGHLIVASHNSNSSRLVVDQLAKDEKNTYLKANVVLAQLLGMCDDLTYNLIEENGVKNIIKYVPWGPPVETKDYLLRRLQENGDAVRSDNGWNLTKNVLKVYQKRLFGAN